MKNGYFVGMFAGAISGVVGAIGATISLILAAIFKLPWSDATLPGVLSFNFLTTHLVYEIMTYLVFGSIFGVIYSIYYDSTPSKGISKGLVFGLILYLISNIRTGVLNVVYFGYEGSSIFAWWWAGFFTLVSYGLVLGFLYEKPTQAIRRYDMKSGVFYGTVAGIVSGIVATIFMVIGVNLKVWDPEHVLPGLLLSTFFVTHHIFEFLVAIAFGAIFGAIFSMYYYSTPGKGVLKGLVYGLILYLMANIRIGVLCMGYVAGVGAALPRRAVQRGGAGLDVGRNALLAP